MIEPRKSRYGTNWEAELQASEFGKRNEDGRESKTVYLRGLQRLAQEAGICKSGCDIRFISKQESGSVNVMQAIYTTEFSDGTVWVGTADCSQMNTDPKFIVYPTAVAESRAEARCLRKALGISILSSEEIGFTDGIQQIEASPTKEIDPQVIKAIEKLCETRNISSAEMLEAVLGKARSGSVFELSELTVDDGQKAMAWLNEQKPAKAKKLTAAEERDLRKKELQGKAE
jgi:hypothetical protein